MITREYTGNYRNDNDEEDDESAWAEEGCEGRREKGKRGGRSAVIGIINDRNRTKMRTGRMRRRR